MDVEFVQTDFMFALGGTFNELVGKAVSLSGPKNTLHSISSDTTTG